MDKRPSFDITATAVNDVTAVNQVPTKTLGILSGNASDSILNDPIIANVLRHDRRDPDGHIVGRVQLAAEGTGLDLTPTTFAGNAESCVRPAVRSRADQLLSAMLRLLRAGGSYDVVRRRKARARIRLP